jgi:flagellar FliJ protein
MARFRFRLQRVLEQRHREEDTARDALARVQSRINLQQAAIDGGAEVRRRLLGSVAGELSGSDTALRSLIIAGGGERAVAARRTILGMQGELETARTGYIKARQRRMAIERLRERALADFRLEERRLEARELSEMAGRRHAGRAREETDA